MHCHIRQCWLLTSLQVRQLVQTNARRVSQRIGLSTLDPFALTQHLEDLAASILRGFPEYHSNRASTTLARHESGQDMRMPPAVAPVGNIRPGARHQSSRKIQDPDSIKRRLISVPNALA